MWCMGIWAPFGHDETAGSYRRTLEVGRRIAYVFISNVHSFQSSLSILCTFVLDPFVLNFFIIAILTTLD